MYRAEDRSSDLSLVKFGECDLVLQGWGGEENLQDGVLTKDAGMGKDTY